MIFIDFPTPPTLYPIGSGDPVKTIETVKRVKLVLLTTEPPRQQSVEYKFSLPLGSLHFSLYL